MMRLQFQRKSERKDIPILGSRSAHLHRTMGNLIDLATKADQIPIEEFVQRTSRFAIVVTKCVWCVVEEMCCFGLLW